MTLVSEIITDAFRQGNLVAVGVSPTTAQTNEALRYLQRIVSSVLGNEVGDPLVAFPLGQNNISRPSNFPYWAENPGPEWFVPKDTRLVLNLESPVDVYLHPMPNDGTRFAVSDTSGNLATNTVTVHGNGRTINGATSVVLNTNGLDQEWFFRADTGNWVVVAPLLTTDTFPFPDSFDDFFVTMLAVRLNPAYGIALDEQSQLILQRARTQLRARYKQSIPVSPELGTVLLSRTSRDSRNWGWGRGGYDQWQPSFGDYPGRWGFWGY